MGQCASAATTAHPSCEEMPKPGNESVPAVRKPTANTWTDASLRARELYTSGVYQRGASTLNLTDKLALAQALAGGRKNKSTRPDPDSSARPIRLQSQGLKIPKLSLAPSEASPFSPQGQRLRAAYESNNLFIQSRPPSPPTVRSLDRNRTANQATWRPPKLPSRRKNEESDHHKKGSSSLVKEFENSDHLDSIIAEAVMSFTATNATGYSPGGLPSVKSSRGYSSGRVQRQGASSVF